MLLPLIIGFLIGTGFVIFALQNTEIVALSFLGWQFASSMALVSVLLFSAGVALSAVVSIPSAIRDSLLARRLRKDNEKLTEELSAANTALANAHAQSGDVGSSLDLR